MCDWTVWDYSFIYTIDYNYSLSQYVQMALSAASPFYRGHVSDIDCRWGVISASVDDRTQEERGLEVRAAVENDIRLYVWACLYKSIQ